MKIILREDVANLGKSGELVEVRNGYGRNYLLPQNLAVLASSKNLAQLEHERKVITAKHAKQRAGALEVAKQLSNAKVKISRKVGEQDKLFGSVTSKDIHEQLATQQYQIDRRQIHLPEPLKELGTHEVEVKLHPEVSAKLKVTVAAEG